MADGKLQIAYRKSQTTKPPNHRTTKPPNHRTTEPPNHRTTEPPNMIFTHTFNNIPARTGDILFTRDGAAGSAFGEIWKLLGRVIPSEFSHCAIYLGPNIRFVESAAKGVVVIEMQGDEWDGTRYGMERLLVDELIGIGDAIAGRGIAAEDETRIRENVVAYCLAQAAQSKPYNLDFFNPDTDGAFYCSQLVYKAYKEQGIDLHPPREDEDMLHALAVFPEDVWRACNTRQRVENAE